MKLSLKLQPGDVVKVKGNKIWEHKLHILLTPLSHNINMVFLSLG